MKYIKLYESFNTDIEDILLEVTDLGYSYTLYPSSVHHCNIIQIHKDRKYFNFYEVKDCLLRLKDYLGNKYIGCSVYYDLIGVNGDSVGWKKFIFTEYSECFPYKTASKMFIKYKKLK